MGGGACVAGGRTGGCWVTIGGSWSPVSGNRMAPELPEASGVWGG